MRKGITYDEMISALKAKKYESNMEWSALESELDLGDHLQKLPQYKASSSLWDAIEESLDEGQSSDKNTQVSKGNYKHILGIAASFLLLIFLVNTMQKNTKEGLEVSYTSNIESINDSSFAFDKSINLETADKFLDENKFVLESATLDQYQLQVNDINDRIEEIKENMSNVETDEYMTKILVRLERKKADLLKNIIQRV